MFILPYLCSTLRCLYVYLPFSDYIRDVYLYEEVG